MEYRDRISKKPEVRFGRPVITGTRIAVSDILGHLAAGDEIDEILAEFPTLDRQDIYACLAFAADRDSLTRIA